MKMRGAAGIAGVVAVLLVGCGPQGLSPEAEQGRRTYLANCIACHNVDPAQPGAVGPPVKGASRELLEAKTVKGTYPPGYTPKRPTAVMQPMPHLAAEIPTLAEYLR